MNPELYNSEVFGIIRKYMCENNPDAILLTNKHITKDYDYIICHLS